MEHCTLHIRVSFFCNFVKYFTHLRYDASEILQRSRLVGPLSPLRARFRSTLAIFSSLNRDNFFLCNDLPVSYFFFIMKSKFLHPSSRIRIKD